MARGNRIKKDPKVEDAEFNLANRVIQYKTKAVAATGLAEYYIQFLAVHVYALAKPADFKFPSCVVVQKVIISLIRNCSVYCEINLTLVTIYTCVRRQQPSECRLCSLI